MPEDCCFNAHRSHTPTPFLALQRILQITHLPCLACWFREKHQHKYKATRKSFYLVTVTPLQLLWSLGSWVAATAPVRGHVPNHASAQLLGSRTSLPAAHGGPLGTISEIPPCFQEGSIHVQLKRACISQWFLNIYFLCSIFLQQALFCFICLMFGLCFSFPVLSAVSQIIWYLICLFCRMCLNGSLDVHSICLPSPEDPKGLPA